MKTKNSTEEIARFNRALSYFRDKARSDYDNAASLIRQDFLWGRLWYDESQKGFVGNTYTDNAMDLGKPTPEQLVGKSIEAVMDRYVDRLRKQRGPITNALASKYWPPLNGTSPDGEDQ